MFICVSLNNDLNLRRLERYLSIAWDSQAIPVIVLTKADLCENVEKKVLEVESVAMEIDIIAISTVEGLDYTNVLRYVRERKTFAFMGSSGVGKSTLVNKLIGEDRFDTKGD